MNAQDRGTATARLDDGAPGSHDGRRIGSAGSRDPIAYRASAPGSSPGCSPCVHSARPIALTATGTVISERRLIEGNTVTITKFGTPIALVAAASLALAGCAANENSGASGNPSGGSLSGTLNGSGSSAMKAAQDKWIADFQTKNSGVTINYSPDGSGPGRTSFISGAKDFGGSDSALNDDEIKGPFAKCASGTGALDLPVYVSPIALIYNISGVTDLKLDADTAAGIFKGTITKWNDPKIVALNPSAKLPDANITAVHRSEDSGTTKNFTDYLASAAPKVWDQKAAGTWPESYKGGEAAKGTAGVVAAVKGGQNTIGYADESQAKEVGIAEIKVGEKFLKPTAEAAAAILEKSEQVTGRKANDLAYKLNRTAADVYPVVLVSYVIVCEQYADAKTGALVKAYVGYVASAEGQASAASAAGSAPLSAAIQAKVKTAVDSIK